MICSSEKRFFTSHLLGVGNWTPNGGATQNRGDVAHANPSLAGEGLLCSPGTREACVSFRVKGHCASERFEHCVDDSQMLGRSLSAPA
ncbi:hypothetical protein BRM08_02700 [Xanthomonas oryzae pv. oryzae]|nr:hypothetical protein EBA21_22740 [Xanthomonas oryzae pv. oryzae]RBD56908.1 hypothetical protein BRM03_08800 [Xanthomonas oryzae pv. oryzae]RBD58264.1 hypothetical protein BRM07_07485 [Xanthomonas oryzae pv. oryzae]RBD72482.1 hypothetical protein BRM12_21560 [Xanthomonas oryzae pv. oryzae]RBD87263.1 hypothetical protein BRM04_02680 [Xanthomonas oryzae pv. oryzae]